VGSITHCAGDRAAAAASTAQFVSLGIDAEIDAPLPGGVLDLVTLPDERTALDRLPRTAVSWPRLLISCKESVYKAWYPLTGAWLDFEQARVTIDVEGAAFHAELLVPGPQVGGRQLTGFDGSWIATAGLLAARCWYPRPGRPLNNALPCCATPGHSAVLSSRTGAVPALLLHPAKTQRTRFPRGPACALHLAHLAAARDERHCRVTS
jgi:hypothetical protein